MRGPHGGYLRINCPHFCFYVGDVLEWLYKKIKRRDESFKSERIGLILYFIAIVTVGASTPFFVFELTNEWSNNIFDIFFDMEGRTGTLFFWLSVCAYVCGFAAMSGQLQKLIDWVNQGK